MVVFGLMACGTGDGTGEVTGTVVVDDCDLRDGTYDMEPNFFSAMAFEDSLEIRVQRGSDLEGLSDGLNIFVRDASAIRRERLGSALTVGSNTEADVRVSFFLNRTCRVGRNDRPFNLEARAGEFVFERIYAPEVDEDAVEVSARFDALVFEDRDEPERRNATLGGQFRFFFSRGVPAQRFP